MDTSSSSFESAIYPVLALPEIVVFPQTVAAVPIAGQHAVHAAEQALRTGKHLLALCRHTMEDGPPRRSSLYDVGAVCEVLQITPGHETKALLEGRAAARVTDLIEDSPGSLSALAVKETLGPFDPAAAKAFLRAAMDLFKEHIQLSGAISGELLQSLSSLEDPLTAVHALSNYASISFEEKQDILESNNLEEKFFLLNSTLEERNRMMEFHQRIVKEVKGREAGEDRGEFLKDQLRELEKDMNPPDEELEELEELARQAEQAGMPAEAKEKADRELSRLSRMAPMSPEATVSRLYLEWLIVMPWRQVTEESIDLAAARKVLERDHFGLTKVKERIIEHLAVTKLTGKTRGPILCLAGPPGVGKTSLARSVARAVGRNFVRIALGGVRDEAEIRGHRRTYIGAMPGKIIQSMKKAAVVNPVLLLDEVDKLASDFRGDPAAALLEVLDPEQNHAFSDHYLEVDYDLSRVMFIATANTISDIPPPLLDRMEIIRITGYTDLEKLEIARRHLVPKAAESSGFRKSQARFRKAALDMLIANYTREAGVRGLEREINSVLRKLAVRMVEQAIDPPPPVTPELVRELLGPERHTSTPPQRRPETGNALGLAWTETGGVLLHVETRTMPGKGNLTLTGTLGEVMRESAQTALSLIRSRADELAAPKDFHETMDIHVHLPEGAIPKDGPSAGITLAASLVSALSGRPLRQDIAMTGELTLRGKILKIGGLKEKVFAAYRNRIAEVIIPEENVPDLEEIAEEVRARITFHPVRDLVEALALVFATPAKKPAKKSAGIQISSLRPGQG